jgi:sugar lactone lactonase YvrE
LPRIAKVGDKLYTADIDELVEINLADGKVLAKYKVEGAARLNDAAADNKGNVYTTDTIKNGIFVLKGGKMEKWVDAPELAGPNGITIDGDNMISASWGILTGKGFETSTPGRMVAISLADKKLTALDGGKPVANLDGIEPLGDGNYIVSDWMAGKVMTFTKDGKLEPIIDLGQGTADMAYDKATKIMYVPQMMKGTLTAVKLP